MGNTFYFPWEISLITTIQSILNDLGISFLKIISELGDRFFLVLIIGLLYWGYDKKIGRYVAENILTSVILNGLVKNIFDRRRPYFDNKEIESLTHVEKDSDINNIMGQGYSFPSGHATNTASCFGSLYIYFKNKMLLIISIIIALLVGLSRFALGVHYPTDVIGGWLLGFLTIYIVSLLRKALDQKKLYITLISFSLIGVFYCNSNDYYSGLGLMIGCFLAFLFEEKYVNFENTNVLYKVILRLIGGAIVFLGISTICKLPFSSEVLDSYNYLAYAIRTFRYGLASFIAIGIYPMLFKKIGL